MHQGRLRAAQQEIAALRHGSSSREPRGGALRSPQRPTVVSLQDRQLDASLPLTADEAAAASTQAALEAARADASRLLRERERLLELSNELRADLNRAHAALGVTRGSAPPTLASAALLAQAPAAESPPQPPVRPAPQAAAAVTAPDAASAAAPGGNVRVRYLESVVASMNSETAAMRRDLRRLEDRERARSRSPARAVAAADDRRPTHSGLHERHAAAAAPPRVEREEEVPQRTAYDLGYGDGDGEYDAPHPYASVPAPYRRTQALPEPPAPHQQQPQPSYRRRRSLEGAPPARRSLSPAEPLPPPPLQRDHDLRRHYERGGGSDAAVVAVSPPPPQRRSEASRLREQQQQQQHGYVQHARGRSPSVDDRSYRPAQPLSGGGGGGGVHATSLPAAPPQPPTRSRGSAPHQPLHAPAPAAAAAAPVVWDSGSPLQGHRHALHARRSATSPPSHAPPPHRERASVAAGTSALSPASAARLEAARKRLGIPAPSDRAPSCGRTGTAGGAAGSTGNPWVGLSSAAGQPVLGEGGDGGGGGGGGDLSRDSVEAATAPPPGYPGVTRTGGGAAGAPRPPGVARPRAAPAVSHTAGGGGGGGSSTDRRSVASATSSVGSGGGASFDAATAGDLARRKAEGAPASARLRNYADFL